MPEIDMMFASLRQLGVPEKSSRRMGAMALDLLGDVGVAEDDLSGSVGGQEPIETDRRHCGPA
jgi:hypothetical protein